jgi:hypothetical protein
MAIWVIHTAMADQLDVVELDEQKQLLFQQVFQDTPSLTMMFPLKHTSKRFWTLRATSVKLK